MISSFKSLYIILEIELVIFRNYIKINLVLGFIRRLNSLVGVSILFIKKKNGSLRLIIDY